MADNGMAEEEVDLYYQPVSEQEWFPKCRIIRQSLSVAESGEYQPRLKASLRKMSKPRYENFGLPYHASLRKDAQPLKPEDPVELVFAFLPASFVFKTGHTIRISVAGADYRERDRSGLSPAPVVTLYNTPDHPSFVSLPIMNR